MTGTAQLGPSVGTRRTPRVMVSQSIYRRLTDVWVGLTEPLGQKSISFNNLLWENGKRYYHGTVAI